MEPGSIFATAAPPQFTPTSRSLRANSYFSRNTPRIFSTDYSYPGMAPFSKSRSKGLLYQLALSVDTLLHAWPDSPGITDRIRMKSAAGIKWNRWSGSSIFHNPVLRIRCVGLAITVYHHIENCRFVTGYRFTTLLFFFYPVHQFLPIPNPYSDHCQLKRAP